MRIGVQWTLATPGDWEWLDLKPGQAARLWERGAKKPKPSGTVTPDNNRGWPMAVNVQGVIFEGQDCYSCVLDPTGTGLVVTAWTEDYPGDNYAQRWTFLPPAPDPAFGGAINTRQSQQVWSQRPEVWPFPVLPWAQFVRPAETLVRYGAQVRDPLFVAHLSARSARDWREWI